MKKIRFGLLFLGAIATLCFLFWPLSSSDFAIAFDEDKINRKLAFLANIEAKNPDAQQPNIIFILADDLSKLDVSLYGGTWLETPNIDALGKSGAHFSAAYTTAPICSPARAALLTGRYQQRFGYEFQMHDRYPRNRLEYYVFRHFISTNNFHVRDSKARYPRARDIRKQGLPPEELSLAEILKKQGYATAALGKWHLGHEPASQPSQFGFDDHYGFYEAFSLYADSTAVGIVNQRIDEFSDKHLWSQGRNGTCALRCNDSIVSGSGYLTEELANEAVQFIEQNRDQPFFLYLPFSAPHSPFQAKQTDYDRFAHIADPYKRIYCAMIYSLDQAVGQIVKQVHSQGLTDNTLICFASDNGGATYTLGTDNAPLKGGKMSAFEGGMNVPMLMSWPGTIAPNMTYESPVSLMDLFATAAAITDTKLPNDRPYDGVNLLPFLSGARKDLPHEALFWRSGYNKSIRSGAWKLILNELDGDTLLYELNLDKFERINQARRKPEVVQDLIQQLKNWERGLMPPRWPGVMDYHFKIGDHVYRFPV